MPTISPEKVHYEAMMKNISTKVATAQKTINIDKIKPMEIKKPRKFNLTFFKLFFYFFFINRILGYKF